MSTASEALAAPPPDAAPPAGGDGAPPSASPEWLAGAEPDLVEYVGKRGEAWKSPVALAKSYRELEQKATWHDAVRLPKDANDQAGWDKVFSALGRPETPDGYELPAIEGADPELPKAAAQWFHAAGVSKQQAGKILEGWNSFQEAQTKAAVDAGRQRNEQEFSEVKASWGTQEPANLELSRRGLRSIGLEGETLEQIETVIGARKLMELALRAGQLTREDAGVGETNKSGLPGTPAAAQAQIKSAQDDKEFMAKVNSGDAAANARMDALYKAAYPV
jgi:hypothetical protein